MTDTILSSRNGQIGHLQLNRPKALNALTTEMIEAIDSELIAWETDESVESVLLTSTSPKAFCAGGDIKAVRDGVLSGDTSVGRRFFELEYAMNARIANYPKPYASVLFGATMGGGIGVSAHGSHRIVTDTLQSSMPETAIGFVPDVGASWILPRLAGGGDHGLAVAIYLGTTGARLGAADALHLGLGTHFLHDGARAAFTETCLDSGLDQALGEHCSDPSEAGTSVIAGHEEWIDRAFSRASAQDIAVELSSMAGESGPAAEWATTALDSFSSHSPTSVAATIELMRAGAGVGTVEDALRNELQLGAVVCSKPDFAEGVRAVLIDKTRDAAWSPDSFDAVDLDAIRGALSA
ncbi:enoyl-CoA hydratase/isomerase family protein [Dietzia sp.]|uniref:enoyl-CoA hydratase/isomerase family protein n=1 Tax=Dietzia sp. TaxID=1871616 RepID=UPI002FDA22A7